MSKAAVAGTATAGSGTSLFTVVGVVFIVLKLTHTIDWSWWWVVSPFIIGFLLSVFFFVIACILFFIAWIVSER